MTSHRRSAPVASTGSGVVRFMGAMLGLIAASAAFSPAAGQSIAGPAVVSATRKLNFGTLTPGFSERILPTEATRRAEIVVTGEGEVELMLMLPSHMDAREHGAKVPLVFGAEDAVLVQAGTAGRVRFDPRERIRVTLPASGSVRIWLGATALVPEDQAAATYDARVEVVVLRSGMGAE